MKALLKDMIKPLYLSFKNKNEKEFYRLLDQFNAKDKNMNLSNIKFFNNVFTVPDMESFIWQFKDIFVNELYRFNTTNNIPIIFDCGSNIGTSLLYFKQKYPKAKIIAFEADENIAKICTENLKKNSIVDVPIIPCAVWIHNNGVDFSIQGADGGSIKGTDNIKNIPSIKLKDFIQQESYIDLLKIDIEGAEYEIFQDCSDSLQCIENIFVEYHSWNNSAQRLSSILEILEKNKFRYYIETVGTRKLPFINHAKDKNMDLQLNIFAHKIKPK